MMLQNMDPIPIIHIPWKVIVIILKKNVLYHYPILKDKLIIGKFCSIAPGVRFIMNGANHLLNAFSTYPFWMFNNGWEAVKPDYDNLPLKGDTAGSEKV